MRYCFRVALAFIVVSAPGAAAQVRDTSQTAQDTARAVPLAPIVVTASHVPVRADRIGFVVSVLDAEDLRRDRPATAASALRAAAGVFIDEAAGPGGPTIVRLRGGEEVFTSILVDGVLINQNGGFFDFQGLTLGNIDHIEIARGPQSALHGSSAVSGVVNFLTRGGDAGTPRMTFSGAATAASGDGGGYHGDVSISGGSAAVRYSAAFGHAYDRGIYDLAHDTRTTQASLRLDAALSSIVDVTGSVRFAGVDAMFPVRDPGATRVALDPNASGERDRLISSIVARLHQGRIDHALSATAYREKFIYDDRFDGVADGQNYPFFVFDANFRLDSRLLRTGLQYDGSLRIGDSDEGDIAVSWGALLEREDLEDETSGDFGPGQLQLDRSNIAAFGEILASPAPWLDLMAGARVDRYEELSAVVTPRASAVIDLLPLFGHADSERLLTARVAAGRAYKAPNLQDQYLDNPFILSNPDLEPETSTSVEAGIDVRSRNGTVTASITAFRQRFDDLIRSVPAGEDGRQQNRNLGSSRATGLEWLLSIRPAPSFSIGTDGTWVSTRILDNSGLSEDLFPEGESLPFRPDVVAAAFLEATLTPTLRAGVRTRYIGEQTVFTERFSGTRENIDAYVLTGLTVNWDVRPRWTVYTRLDNLLGTEYETAFDRRGIPATASIGLEWRN
ncbi:MAG: TonB-dependent receptor plug domain-containing protein [Longimicrobiales bacterium]